MSKDNGRIVKSVNKHKLSFVRYMPLRGYLYLLLPATSETIKGLINIKNEKDNEYFR